MIRRRYVGSVRDFHVFHCREVRDEVGSKYHRTKLTTIAVDLHAGDGLLRRSFDTYPYCAIQVSVNTQVLPSYSSEQVWTRSIALATPYAAQPAVTFAQAMRAVLTRIVTSGRLRSPSNPKSNKECMKSTFSARVTEQRRAKAHLSMGRYAAVDGPKHHQQISASLCSCGRWLDYLDHPRQEEACSTYNTVPKTQRPTDCNLWQERRVFFPHTGHCEVVLS